MKNPSKNKDADLSGFNVLLCVTGGIACYKSADLTSRLVQSGAVVNVVMTEAAQKFVTPLTFQTLSGRNVYTSMWETVGEVKPNHIPLTEQTDIMVIAPATANTIAKLAVGIADNLVSTMGLSAHGACPILIAPAMNCRMWDAPVTQQNLQILKDRGVAVIGPDEGYLACGTTGMGRMSEPGEIVDAIKIMLEGVTPKSSVD